VLPQLPYSFDLETVETLKLVAGCCDALGELRGIAESMPSETVLISTLALQEAKESSEIENIITTNDDLYKGSLFRDSKLVSPAAKEVNDYSVALIQGFLEVRRNKLIRLSTVLQIQEIIEKNDAGIRSQAGTVIRSQDTGETVYAPPQDRKEIDLLLANLLDFINDHELSDLHPIIKMALIHYQFEKIHPFYDGNGRTGRIIMMLYLVSQGVLNLPVLYLSRYITRTKQTYYQLLREEFCEETLTRWVHYFLIGIQATATDALDRIYNIKTAMMDCKQELRSSLPRIYSQELLNNLFAYPYTKIDFVQSAIGVSRPTASKYLNEIVGLGLLSKRKIGNSNYYINDELFNILTAESEAMQSYR